MKPQIYRLATRMTALEGGERRSRQAGAGGEFFDYRPYEPGDEPRDIDWNVYARSKRLFVRRYRLERATRIYAALDESASMGDKRAAAERVLRFVRPFARNEVWRERRLASLGADLVRLASLPPGLVILISDGLEPLETLHAGLSRLRLRGFDLSFIQLLSRDDLDPPMGAWRLHDAEGTDVLEVDETARERYLTRLAQHLEGVALAVRRLGFRHTRLMREFGEAELWVQLRRGGVLERGSSV